MTDIRERLLGCHGIQSGDPDCCCQEAAAEIARLHKIELQFLALQEERVRWFADNEWLTADNERLRAALMRIIKKDKIEYSMGTWEDGDCARIARRALGPKPTMQEISDEIEASEREFRPMRRALEPKP